MSKDNDVTTLQEYIISGIVITFFGLLYWYLSGGFAGNNNQNISPEGSSQGYTLTSLGSSEAGKLSLKSDSAPLSSSSTISPPNNSIAVEEAKAEVELAKSSVELDNKSKESPKEDLAQLKAKIDKEEQKDKNAEQQLATTSQEVQAQKSTVEAAPKVNDVLQKTEDLKEEKHEEVVSNDLIYLLPNGQKVEIPKDGFENKFREAIIKGDRDTPIIFDRVYFETGSKELSPQSDYQVASTAALLNTYKDINIVIRGHSDNRGSSKKNAQLSLFRSGSMKKALVKLGIDPKRISIEGIGDAEPVASNKTKRGRRNNRRIDLIIK